MIALAQIFPGTGRGTIRRMVEGKPDCASFSSIPRTRYPSTTPLCVAVTLPVPGRILLVGSVG